VLGWVHTCNVTAYRNTVTLQVADTLRSYELNFHPVPRGVTVSCERCALGLPVCYWSPSDVFAASSGFIHLYIHYALKKKREKSGGGDVSSFTSRPYYGLTNPRSLPCLHKWSKLSLITGKVNRAPASNGTSKVSL